MEYIIRSVGQVIKALTSTGLIFYSSDDFDDAMVRTKVEDRTVTVGDDRERNQWRVELHVLPKEGIDLHQIVASALGPPIRVHLTGGKVTNFKLERVNVIVDHSSIEFFQNYDKV